MIKYSCKRLTALSLLLVLTLFLVACGDNANLTSYSVTATNAISNSTPTISLNVAKSTIKSSLTYPITPPTITTIALTTPSDYPTVTYGPTATPALPPDDLTNTEYRWLLGIPCKLPCWENIILGQTTNVQALKALQQNSFVDPISQDLIENNQIQFFWSSKAINSENYNGSNEIDFNAAHTVNLILLETDVKFSTVIRAFGQPTSVETIKVLSSPEGDNSEHSHYSYIYYLIYPKQGLMLETSQHHEFDLTADSIIETIRFTLPNQIDTLLKKINDTGGDGISVIWEGFKSFDYYCRDTTQPSQHCT